ncbi:TPA: hypothetical protein ACYLN4_000872 [Burkholderia lata]
MIDATLITGALEWASAVAGLTGAYLLAANRRISRWGWVGLLLANLFAIGFALRASHCGLLVQQVGFIGSSVLGIWRSGLIAKPVPHCDRKREGHQWL